jgi:hypothetical protein
MNTPRLSQARQRREPYKIAGAAWMDLIGYGTALGDAAFNPSDPRARVAEDRLHRFHVAASDGAHSRFPVMLVNDAAIFFRDLSFRAISVTYDFLFRCISAWQHVNALESKLGHPGARMVIAVAIRIDRERVFKVAERHLERILQRLAANEISTTHAVHEAFRSQPIAGFVPALQSNFAFTKAYLAENSGTKGGLPGSSCYIDMAFFENRPPTWIRFKRIIKWSQRGISATFAELDSIDNGAASRVFHVGIRPTDAIMASLIDR